MEQTKPALIALVVSLLVGAFTFMSVDGVTGPQGPAGQDGQTVGAISSPNIASSFLQWGGVTTWQYRTETLNSASTTVCSAQGPAATSTATAMVRLDVSSTSATIIQFGTGAHSNATTTRMGTNVAVAANAKATAFASTTIVAPNGWVNVGLTGGTGTHSPSGACNFIFTQI